MNKCCVDWCNNVPNVSGNGYCRKHYDQMRKYGHILPVRSQYDPNRINIKGDTAEIIITDRTDNVICTAIIDAEDVDRVKRHKWSFQGKYVRTSIKNKNIYLHRFIMNYNGDLDIDHINRNRLDNRKVNLRICTRSLNLSNKKCKGYRDTKRKLSKPYYVRISTKDKVFAQYVNTEEEAQKLAYEKRVELGIYKET